MAPTLSIVVPIYKVEEYLAECLESLTAQTLTDLEIIMVDDGSPDGSADIAREFEARDPRFRLVRKQNEGLGPARNTGAEHATGTYLAFLDSDDKVPSYAYELMVGSLEKTGSDLVSGGVDRFDAERAVRAKFYRDTFARDRLQTHVSRDPALLRDRTAWNKVFRRAFWDEHGFAFPPGAYEDIPVMIPAHVRATSVDVLSETIYLYRVRESGGELSITQRRTEATNLEDRLRSVGAVSEFLRTAAPDLKDAYDLASLEDDLMIFLNAAEDGDAEYRERLCRLVGAYVAGFDARLFDSLPSLARLKYHLTVTGRGDDLARVREYERTGRPVTEPEARGLLRRRWYAGHPFRDDPERAIPAAVYDMTDELELSAQIDDIVWDGGTVRLTGHAYVDGLPMTADDQIDVWLRHTKSNVTYRPALRRVDVPEVTATSRQSAVGYDGAGFVVDVETDRLPPVPNTVRADWQFHVTVKAGRGRDRIVRSGPILTCGPIARWARYRDLDGRRVQVVQDAKTGVTLRLRQPEVMLTGQEWGADALTLSGWTTTTGAAADRLVLASRERGTRVRLPVAYGTPEDGRTPFRCAVPYDEFTGSVAEAEAFTETIGHTLALSSSGGTPRLSVPDDFTESAGGQGAFGFVIGRTRYGNALVNVGPAHLVATRASWDGDTLVIGGAYAGAVEAVPPPTRLALQRRRGGERHVVPLAWDGSSFEARFRPGAMPGWAGELPLIVGTWDIAGTDAEGRQFPLRGGRNCFGDLPEAVVAAGFRFRVWPSRGAGLHLSAQIDREPDEFGPYKQRILEERDYPAFLRRPVRDLITFESFFGWQYSCNPKAIYEEFRRRDTGHELVWVLGDRHFTVPDGGRTVQRFSREYYELTAQARIVVNNAAQPHTYLSRPDQLYVQTWHGTPIKSVGFEMLWSTMERRDQRQRVLAEDIARWGLLLTQNPFTTEVMRRAFHYDGEVLESGYPRNDAAHRPDAARVRARVRHELGIPDGKRAVLYAPTWRDNLRVGAGLSRHQLGLDLERAAAALGGDTVLLLRLHHMLNVQVPDGLEHFVMNVTDHPDITELFIASDALVTDYSSVMCDYSGLRRPILLFAPDFESYRDDVRGFTFDLEAQAPGPILRSSDELIGALEALDTVAADSAPALEQFAKSFAPFDDGHAAARVVDHLLSR
ncbi:bifunctional glycosyltransferase/CDP-glycerol:glycerophosphate glycerophosphotransferase [Actinomadura flavalba]|uniref:bifunctional glycosyltransferase/CDP-glycerol:glycerophosphate glycerophosphotransferase n=1 Tax=Actinomadura flavalba TaxID=1120938 RepID=UPI00035E73EA|nr:bifunctional glycosyltransferase/CDP-glycerol:glycerophosphate glycerophosphotransferase [Actinomadura flavalba]